MTTIARFSRIIIAMACVVALPLAAKELGPVPEEVSIIETSHGFSFQNTLALPFYVYDKDTKDKSNCIDACTESWAPIKAPDNAKPLPDWTLVVRPEGYKQWAYRGRPIYVSIPEMVEGKVTPPKEWHVLVP